MLLTQELQKERPTVKLLYITPEQLVASAALASILESLQKRGLLARFVVDEVSYLLESSFLLPVLLKCALSHGLLNLAYDSQYDRLTASPNGAMTSDQTTRRLARSR